MGRASQKRKPEAVLSLVKKMTRKRHGLSQRQMDVFIEKEHQCSPFCRAHNVTHLLEPTEEVAEATSIYRAVKRWVDSRPGDRVALSWENWNQ